MTVTDMIIVSPITETTLVINKIVKSGIKKQAA